MLTEQICKLKPAIRLNLKLTEFIYEWHPDPINSINQKAGIQKYTPFPSSEDCFVTRPSGKRNHLRLVPKVSGYGISKATFRCPDLVNNHIPKIISPSGDLFENST
jgi:hypothetical protein